MDIEEFYSQRVETEKVAPLRISNRDIHDLNPFIPNYGLITKKKKKKKKIQTNKQTKETYMIQLDYKIISGTIMSRD